MVRYASVIEFVAAFGEVETTELTNLDANLNSQVINLVPLNRALEDASAEIDAYLQSAGFELPLPFTPIALIRCCNDIARYRLDKNRQREDVRARYDDTLKFLMAVAKGEMQLGAGVNDQGVVTTITTPQLPQYFTSDRAFTPDSLQWYGARYER